MNKEQKLFSLKFKGNVKKNNGFLIFSKNGMYFLTMKFFLSYKLKVTKEICLLTKLTF